jgi:hypothetical protein
MFADEIKQLTKDELLELLDNYDTYIAEFTSENEGLKLIDDVEPESIESFYESRIFNREVF